MQIRRAMRRLFGEEHRQLLDERLVVHEGPLKLDLGRVPEQLIETVQDAGAGSVFIDSLKDAAVKLTDDEVGGNLNRAVQFAVRDGIEVVGLHHQRKGQGGSGSRRCWEGPSRSSMGSIMAWKWDAASCGPGWRDCIARQHGALNRPWPVGWSP